MDATKGQAGTSTTLLALTSAALALPGMVGQRAVAGTPLERVQFNSGYFYYDESGERMTVETVQSNLAVPLGDDWDVVVNGVRDAIAGASPIYNLPKLQCTGAAPGPIPARAAVQAVVGASDGGVVGPPTPAPDGVSCRQVGVEQVMFAGTFQDTRDVGDVRLNYYRGDTTIGLSGGISRERDYSSDFASIDLRRDFNQKLSTLALGYGIASDEYRPVNQPGFVGDKTNHQFLVGLTQVVGKNTLVQVNATYAYGSGFLTDPYKFVYVETDNSIVSERRPNARHQGNVLGRLVQYVPRLGAAVHLDYRYSVDSWGVDAHTFEFSWLQDLGAGWQLAPTFRFYSQNRASFYRDFFTTLPADGHFSSDYRLATFGATSYGVHLSKRVIDKLRLDAGFEYYDRRSEYALGGNADSSFADYSYIVYNVGVSINF